MFVLTAPATAERRAFRRVCLSIGTAEHFAAVMGLDNYTIAPLD